MKIKLTAVLLMLSLLFSLASCVDITEVAQTDDETDNYFFQDDLVVTDYDGNTFTLASMPKRVVCVTPVAAEIISGIGASAYIVACGAMSKDLIKGNNRTEIIDFFTAENIIALSPDMVFVSPLYSLYGTVAEEVKAAGIRIVSVADSGDLDTVYSNIRFFGSIMFKTAAAEQLVGEVQHKIKSANNLARYKGLTLKVYIENYASGSAFASDTILDDLAKELCMNNVYGDKEGVIAVDHGSTAQLDPEFIIAVKNNAADKNTDFKNRDGWADVMAVKNGKIVHVERRSATLPTQGILRALDAIMLEAGLIVQGAE